MNDVITKALENYGGNNQAVVCMEELSELIKELSKLLRGIGSIDHIAEEIADVEIMLAQMIMFYNIQNSVEKWKSYKLNRLEKRLEQGKG